MNSFPFSTRAAAAAAVLAVASGAQGLPLVDESTRLPSEAREGVAALAADLDLDGFTDLIHLEPQRIQTWMQDRKTGRYVVKATVPLAATATTTIARGAVGRLAGNDAVPDLVVAQSNGQLLVLQGDGQGGLVLVPGSVVPTLQGVPSQVLVADFDKAHADDILLLYDGVRPVLLLAQSTGVFTPSLGAPQPALTGAQGAATDINGDGFPDVVLASSLSTSPLLVWNVQGSLATGAIAIMATPTPPIARVLLADLNQDGKPDLVLGPAAAPTPVAPLVFLGTGQMLQAFVTASTSPFTCNGIRDLAAVDLARRGLLDLVVQTTDGSLLLASNTGSGVFAPLGGPLLGPGPRGNLLVGDFDLDQDQDIFVAGAGTEPVLLLGGKAGWFATERDAFPIGPASRPTSLGALVDATGDGDPDVVLLDPLGQVSELYRGLGDGRFAAPAPAPVPPLPAGSSYTRLLPAALALPGAANDLVVLGTSTGSNPTGVRVLIAQPSGGYLDETAQRWPSGILAPVAIAVGTTKVGAVGTFSDLVVAEAGGKLWHLRPSTASVRLAVVPGSLVGTVVPNVTILQLGALDGDDRTDLLIIDMAGKVTICTGAPLGTLQLALIQVLGSFPAQGALIGDFDSDGNGDVLLLTPTLYQGLTHLKGIGGGFMYDTQGSTLPPRLPAALSALAQVGNDVVLGTHGSGAELLRPVAVGFGPAVPLPTRGSLKLTDLLVGDVDLDGDPDVVAVRREAHPCLMRGSAFQLTQLGVSQGGRGLGLRFRGPPGGLVALFWSPTTARIPQAPYGILRLAATTNLFGFTLPATGTPGVADITFAIPAVGSDIVMPFQALYIDLTTLEVRLSNLELARAINY